MVYTLFIIVAFVLLGIERLHTWRHGHVHHAQQGTSPRA